MDVDFDELVKCPWCVSHDIVKKKLEGHYRILKKQKNPCVKDLRNCKYNSHHKIHKNAMETHYLECVDALEHFVQEDFTIPVQGFNQAVDGRALANTVRCADLCDETPWDELPTTKDDASCREYRGGESGNNCAEETVLPNADIPTGTSDFKKSSRKLEKKLKEIAKLENKGNLTQEEKDKIAKKNNLEKELEELKTRWDQMHV